ncbi:MAG: V-type ATPase 116kDa subunit family protein, partial [Candidatus Omnitrophota bacterium]
MLIPAPMEFFCAVILNQDLDRATDFFLRRNILHLVQVRDMEPWGHGLGLTVTEAWGHRCRDMAKRIAVFLPTGKEIPAGSGYHASDYFKMDLDHIERQLVIVEQRWAVYQQRKASWLGLIEANGFLFHRLQAFGSGDIGRVANGRHTFLATVLVQAEAGQRDYLEQSLSVILHVCCPFVTENGESMVLVVALKRDIAAVKEALAKINLAVISPGDIPEGDPEKIRSHMRAEVIELKRQIEHLDKVQARHAARLAPVLRRLQTRIMAAAVMAEAQVYFQRTARTHLIAGWLPRICCAETGVSFKKMLNGCCYVRADQPRQVMAVAEKKEQVPVLLDNPSWLKPFEMMVTNYDVPRYGTIDPTLFVALSFLVMFGAMFGDAGQGALILVVGIFLLFQKNALLAGAGLVAVCAGIAVMLFGLLYGSFFGMENVIPALWMKPMVHPADFFLIAIGFGVVMICMGVVMNIINTFRSGDLINGIFGVSGVNGGLIYGTGLALAVGCGVFKVDKAHLWVLWLVLGCCLVVMFFKAPVEKLISPRARLFPEGIFSYFLETGVKIIELGLGYMTNTLSYIRLV